MIIPASHVENLMLKESVVEAVREGKFHLWAVDIIEEGIETLTGVKAGLRKKEGGFEEGMVFAKVDTSLQELAERLAKFRKED